MTEPSPRRQTDNDVMPSKRRRAGSNLVPLRASISVDWCARQGLMSANSMRRLVKENKKEDKQKKRGQEGGETEESIA